MLFLLLRGSTVYRNASLAAQWFGAASFVILVQFYFAWLIWFQKPETLPTAAILALALLLLTIKLPLPETAGRIGAVIGLLLLAMAQGLVRADVGFALHAGILLVCLTPAGKGFALPRRVQAATSFVALLLVLGIQYYLMMRKYPHATYGDTPVLQLFFNLKSVQGYIPFVIFMAPLVWTTVILARRKYRAGSATAAMFVAAIIFMGMWVTVGETVEVRIFLPFALVLAPLTVELAMERFFAGQPEARGIEPGRDRTQESCSPRHSAMNSANGEAL
jgi:hypothetical protein